MKVYKPLPYRNGAEILKGPYEKEGQTKCPIIGSNVKEKRYISTCVDYKFKNKKGNWEYVEGYDLRIKWLD